MQLQGEGRQLLRLKFCYLLVLVVLAQLMIPVLLLMYSSVDNHEITSFCPSSADWISRSLAFLVGCIYQVRIILLFEGMSNEPIKVKAAKYTVWLKLALLCDSFMNIPYELLVYITNFCIVFFTSNPLDMVLNALALEFILQLDNGVKDKYIAIFTKDHRHHIIQNYADTFELQLQPVVEQDVETPQTGADKTNHYSWRYMLNCMVISFVQYVLPFLTLLYLPICKPK